MLRRFENSRNVEMTALRDFARSTNEFFKRLEQLASLPLVLQPVANFFSFAVIPDEIRSPKLRKVPAYSASRQKRNLTPPQSQENPLPGNENPKNGCTLTICEIKRLKITIRFNFLGRNPLGKEGSHPTRWSLSFKLALLRGFAGVKARK